MGRCHCYTKIESSIPAEEVVAEMALEVADIEREAALKESKMRKVLEAAADVADEICDEVSSPDILKSSVYVNSFGNLGRRNGDDFGGRGGVGRRGEKA